PSTRNPEPRCARGRRSRQTSPLRRLPPGRRQHTTRLIAAPTHTLCPSQTGPAMKRALLLACAAVVLLLPARASADVKLPSVFASHMVVQRDKPIVVWGWADKDESVTVTFAGKEATARADDKGNWKVSLPKFEANARAQSMTIKGNNTIELEDVLI